MKTPEYQHFYRIKTGVPTGMLLKNILDRSEDALREAALLAAQLGAVRFTQNDAFLAGGIGNLYFDKKPNERAYETVRRRGRYFVCYPNRSKEAGAKIFERIMQLPTVSFSILTPVFGDMPQGFTTPAFFEYQDDIYLASTTPLQLEHQEEINPGTWAAMEKERKLFLKNQTNH